MNSSLCFYEASAPRQSFRAALLAALGGAPATIEPGRIQRFPTSQRQGDQAGWSKMFNDELAGVFGDHRSGFRSCWHARSAAAHRLPASFKESDLAAVAADRQNRQWVSNGATLQRLWSDSLPLCPGDLVSRYLSHRGIELAWPAPLSLRFHPRLPYWQSGRLLNCYPAMVASVTSPDGRLVALHRTYLSTEARKADVVSPKKLSKAAGSLAGATISLGHDGSTSVGVAEGIETALAAAAASGISTNAAYCAGNLASWCWPPGARRLVVFADNDETGLGAARTLAARALGSGLQCDVFAPSTAGADWCDVWASRHRVERGQGSQS